MQLLQPNLCSRNRLESSLTCPRPEKEPFQKDIVVMNVSGGVQMLSCQNIATETECGVTGRASQFTPGTLMHRISRVYNVPLCSIQPCSTNMQGVDSLPLPSILLLFSCWLSRFVTIALCQSSSFLQLLLSLRPPQPAHFRSRPDWRF